MKLNKRNIEALIAARDKGSARAARRGSKKGGAFMRMLQKLADEGLITGGRHPFSEAEWRLTDAGLRALQEIDRKALKQ